MNSVLCQDGRVPLALTASEDGSIYAMVRELVKTGYVPVLEIFGIFRKLPLLLVLSRNAWFSVTLNSYFAVKLFLSRVKIFSPFRKTFELCKCWYYINR